MSPPSIIDVRERLQHYSPRHIPGNSVLRHAAVASILRDTQQGLEVLLIQRAERKGDRWSGHMAFPGGRQEAGDPDHLATARRETFEEIGLNLSTHADVIAPLSHVMAKARGRIIPMVIHPFVFALRELPTLTPNQEVQNVVWVPIDFLLDPNNRSTMDYRFAGINTTLPCYHYENYTIWGLTLRMLDELTALLGRPS